MLTTSNHQRFSTFDHDQDSYSGSCANEFKAGWWYRDCHRANLNGLYHGGPHTTFGDGINWKSWRGQYYSLKRTEMKIRKKTSKI